MQSGAAKDTEKRDSGPNRRSRAASSYITAELQKVGVDIHTLVPERLKESDLAESEKSASPTG